MGQEASGIRINKYLSEVGHCSRRAADKLLEQGRITLNGVLPELGTKVMPKKTSSQKTWLDHVSASCAIWGMAALERRVR